jgi:hypothetical protein
VLGSKSYIVRYAFGLDLGLPLFKGPMSISAQLHWILFSCRSNTVPNLAKVLMLSIKSSTYYFPSLSTVTVSKQSENIVDLKMVETLTLTYMCCREYSI